MKKHLFISVWLFAASFVLRSQSNLNILYLNTFSTNLGSCVAANSSSGAWVWSNSCGLSSSTGHTGPGHAMFQGSGCQFGNGSATVSGDLRTPTIAIPATGGTLTFNYYVSNECGNSGNTCTYDVLNFGISTNNGSSFTTIMSSSGNPSGLTNTSAWTAVSYNLSSYSGQTIMIQFNFNSIDGIGNTYDGIYVDDIQVAGTCTNVIVPTSGGNTVIPSVCAGNSLTLTTAAVSGYSWSTGATTPSIVVSPSVNTNYSLTATTSLACQATTVIAISVSSVNPVLAVNASTNSVCFGKAVTLTASGATSYSWTGGITNGTPFTPSVSGNYTVTAANGCGTSSAVTSITVAPIIVTMVANPTIVCVGQQALLSVSAPANTYTWLPLNNSGASNTLLVSPSVNSTFTVAASDGTCFGTATVNVATKPNPTLSISGTATTVCQGDPVTITVSGALTYTWSPVTSSASSITVNPTAPSSYSVGGTNAVGCTAGTVFVVITNPSPTITAISSDNIICSGSSATLTASGASNYNWSSGSTSAVTVETPLSTTIYTVTGTANGCASSQTVEVDVITPTVSITGNTVLCMGLSGTLTASGASSYTWLPNSPFPALSVNPLSTTIYTLSYISASGGLSCPGTTTTQVLVNPNPTITAVASRTAICKNESTILTGSGASSMLWSVNGVSVSANPSLVVTSTLVTTLTYTLKGTNSNNCSSTVTLAIRINGCNGVEEYTGNNEQFLVYPIPNSGNFTIQAQNAMVLTLVNELGQLVKTIELNENNQFTTKISGLNSGVYFVSGQNNNQLVRQKVIVNK